MSFKPTPSETKTYQETLFHWNNM